MSGYSNEMVYRLAMEDINYWLKKAMKSTDAAERGKLLHRVDNTVLSLCTHEDCITAGDTQT